jgi:hypothetical protein
MLMLHPVLKFTGKGETKKTMKKNQTELEYKSPRDAIVGRAH